MGVALGDSGCGTFSRLIIMGNAAGKVRLALSCNRLPHVVHHVAGIAADLKRGLSPA